MSAANCRVRRYTGLPCPGTQSRPTDACRFARTQLFLWHCTTHVLQTAAVAANVTDGTSLGCGASACPRFIHLRPSTRSWVCPSVALRVSVCLALALARSLSVSLSLCLSLSLSVRGSGLSTVIGCLYFASSGWLCVSMFSFLFLCLHLVYFA